MSEIRWHLALWPGTDSLISARIFWWLRSKLNIAVQWKLKTRTHCSCKPTVNAGERECQPASVNDCQEADANAGYHIVCCYTWQLSKQYQTPRDYSSTWCNALWWPRGQEEARKSVMFTHIGANFSTNMKLNAIVSKSKADASYDAIWWLFDACHNGENWASTGPFNRCANCLVSRESALDLIASSV